MAKITEYSCSTRRKDPIFVVILIHKVDLPKIWVGFYKILSKVELFISYLYRKFAINKTLKIISSIFNANLYNKKFVLLTISKKKNFFYISRDSLGMNIRIKEFTIPLHVDYSEARNILYEEFSNEN